MLQTVRRNVRAALRGRKSFVIGAGKALDIGNTLVLQPDLDIDFISEPLYGDVQSDYDRLKSDWAIVGNDLREAISTVGESHVARVQR